MLETSGTKKTLILRDFNFNGVSQQQNFILRELENWSFKQLIQNQTHIQGELFTHGLAFACSDIPITHFLTITNMLLAIAC